MKHPKTFTLFLLLALLCAGAYAAPTKFDFFHKDYTECGIVSCTTYYTVTNPGVPKVTVDQATLKVKNVLEFKGKSKGFSVEFFNGTAWEGLNKKSAPDLSTGQTLKVRVIGSFTPVYTGKDEVSYSIDHIPSAAGFDFPEYDLWNQTWGKCVDMNFTYTNLKNYSQINESFPQRVLLNSSNINISAIRSDWGDVRFAKGVCANISTDYVHTTVATNASNAEMIFIFNGGDVVNNTVARVAVYYNNSLATHVDPSRMSISWGNGNMQDVRIFTHDKATTDTTTSKSVFNDTNGTTLDTYGTGSVANRSMWYTEKGLGANSSLYTLIPADGLSAMDGLTGFGSTFRIRLNNATKAGDQYLMTIGNVTNTMLTNVMVMYITTATTSSSSYYDVLSQTMGSSGSFNQCVYYAYNSTANISVSGITKTTLATPTRCLFFSGNVYPGVAGNCATLQTPNATGTFSGSTCTFNASVSVTARQNFTIAIDNAGSAWTQYYGSSGLPGDGNTTLLRWLGAQNDGGTPLDGNPRSITGVLFSTVVAATTTHTLNVNVSYEDAALSVSAALGTLQENVSYDVGVSFGKSNLTLKRTVVTFNGSTVYDNESVFTGTGYPFKANASCPDAADTCIKNFVFGGQGVLNASGDLVGTVGSFNGTIDEIIVAGMNTGRTEKFLAPLMLGWASFPSVTYSSSYTANVYPPTIVLTMSPSSPTFNDDTNASVLFTDFDYLPVSNVTIEWRVNGSLIRTTILNITGSPQTVSDLLAKGNYSKGSTLNITAWGTDGLYTTANSSFQVTIGGIRPNPITSLACNPLNKTAINCSWTNPASHQNTSLYRNSSLITVVSNTTTAYTFLLLTPNSSYNLSFFPQSADGTVGNQTDNISYTFPNYGPNITSYTPTNLTPTFGENTTQNFTINATDDDGNPIITWFKDNVFQTVASFFTWAIGLNEQGTHNITAIVNDSYGAEARQTWIVTVTDDYPAPTTPRFDPDGGKYRTYIPLLCKSENTFSAVDYYDITMSVNGSAYENLSMGNRFGFVQLDITQYNYGSNFTFTCAAYGQSGNSSATSQQFKKDYVNEFYATTAEKTLSFTSLAPYVFSLYYDVQNPTNNVTVQYSYADCNGDGLYDYVYNYTDLNPRRVKQTFTCVFPKGNVKFEIGAFIKKNSGDSWAGSGCSSDFDYSNTCKVTKNYGLTVT